MKELTDQELLRLCQKYPPEKEVWEELFRRYYPIVLKQVRSFCFKHGMIDVDPYDLLHDAWERLIKAVSNYNFEAEFIRYLRVIVYRSLVDQLRLRESESFIRLMEEEEFEQVVTNMVEGAPQTPSQILEKREILHTLEQYLDELSSDQRAVLTSYYLEGRSLSEIARELKKSTSTVYVLKYRGLQRLRELMGSTQNHL